MMLTPGLSLLYLEWLKGWRPDHINEDRYNELKDAYRGGAPLTPEMVFAGFSLSFGGKWFGGWARGKRHPNATPRFEQSVEFLEKKIGLLQQNSTDYVFGHQDYTEITGLKEGDLLYCDPPYVGTTGYSKVPSWTESSHEDFWVWAEEQADQGVIVYVSESTYREGWEIVWSKPKTSQVSVEGGREYTEYLMKRNGRDLLRSGILADLL